MFSAFLTLAGLFVFFFFFFGLNAKARRQIEHFMLNCIDWEAGRVFAKGLYFIGERWRFLDHNFLLL